MIRRRLPIGRSRRVSGAWVAQHVYFGISDVLLWVLSYALALLIRFDGAIPPQFIAAMPVVLILFLPVKLAWNAVFRLYRVTWALVGLKEIVGAWKASTAATLTLAGGLFLLQGIHAYGTFPRGVLILDYLLGTTLIAVSRLGRRLSNEIPRARSRTGGGSRVLLVGAGEAGGMIARSMVSNGHAAYHPVGFIDDDASKWGTFVHGLKVMGGKEAIPDAVRKLEVDEVVITFVSAGSGHVRDIMRFAREAGITRVRVLPSVHELLTGHVTVHDIRDVNLEDLLGRKPAPIDANRVAAFLRGQTVLVTGAAGSIGSELARQLSRSDAARVLLLDTNETALFHLAEEIIHPPLEQRVQTVIADVRDSDKIQKVFSAWRPDVVYHAAAYKHVPLMERHPDEAVRTNILGTLAVAEAALACGTQTFVLISTDKAVNATSVMGATKRLAEWIVKALNARGGTRFLAVRFGNVIGSRGSVVPVLQEQIRRGGPVTITHPEMTRYFMSTREAVALVLQASASQESHDIFMLDMGRPIKILDLAEELIRLSGLEPDTDIPIVFTGIRPGEQLHEALETSDEPLGRTTLPGMFAVRTNGRVDEVILRLAIQELDRLSRAMDLTGVKRVLHQMVTSSEPMPVWLGGNGDALHRDPPSPRATPAREQGGDPVVTTR